MLSPSQDALANMNDLNVNTIPLERFEHQVAGTLPIFQHDDILYKPCFENEVLFYEHVSTQPHLQPYVPAFYGEEILDHTPESLATSLQPASDWHKKITKNVQTKRVTGNRFIKLECLTFNFHRPCVLDLKLGTQQHRPDHSPEKIKKSMTKCFTTTSRELGLRFCGMRMYKQSMDSYTCVNKYEGREWDADDFLNGLHRFFVNESGVLRKDICEMVIEKLIGLEEALDSSLGCRFYSSSLLIVYESDGGVNVDVRMIDFNQSMIQGMSGHDEPDYGALFGVESLRRLVGEIGGDKMIDWDHWRSSSAYVERALSVFDGFEVAKK